MYCCLRSELHVGCCGLQILDSYGNRKEGERAQTDYNTIPPLVRNRGYRPHIFRYARGCERLCVNTERESGISTSSLCSSVGVVALTLFFQSAVCQNLPLERGSPGSAGVDCWCVSRKLVPGTLTACGLRCSDTFGGGYLVEITLFFPSLSKQHEEAFGLVVPSI